MSRLIIAGALVAAAAATPASAQSLLDRIARGALEEAASRVVNPPRRGEERGAAAPDVAAPNPEAAASGGSDSVADSFPAPPPINYTPRLRGPSQLQFPPELESAEAAFDEFNRVACTGCEGGRSYDSWIKHHVREVQPMWALENRIGEMAVGEAIRWTGTSGARLALTVIGEEPVGAWPCKQVRWSSERDDASAERLGLFCHGKRGDYLGDGWVEVL